MSATFISQVGRGKKLAGCRPSVRVKHERVGNSGGRVTGILFKLTKFLINQNSRPTQVNPTSCRLEPNSANFDRISDFVREQRLQTDFRRSANPSKHFFVRVKYFILRIRNARSQVLLNNWELRDTFDELNTIEIRQRDVKVSTRLERVSLRQKRGAHAT